MGEDIFDMKDPDYLRNLAERLMHVPAMYGVDGGDIDRLSGLATKLEESHETPTQ